MIEIDGRMLDSCVIWIAFPRLTASFEGRGPLHDMVGRNCNKGSTTEGKHCGLIIHLVDKWAKEWMWVGVDMGHSAYENGLELDYLLHGGGRKFWPRIIYFSIY